MVNILLLNPHHYLTCEFNWIWWHQISMKTIRFQDIFGIFVHQKWERERERDGERQFLPNEIKAKLEIKISQIFDQINEIKNLN